MRAPGGPGTPPRIDFSRPSLAGSVPQPESRVWFQVALGNLGQVCSPSVDHAVLHSLRFLVAGRGAPPIDDALEASHRVDWTTPGIPAANVVSAHAEYRLTKVIFADPASSAIVITGSFTPNLPDLRLYFEALPNCAADPDRVVARVFEGATPVPTVRSRGVWMAVAGPIARASVGFLNWSNLAVDLHDNDGVMLWDYDEASGGHVALGGELALAAGPFQLALGFGASEAEAEEVAHDALGRGASSVYDTYRRIWQAHGTVPQILSNVTGDGGKVLACSVAVLRTLEDRDHPGAFATIAELPSGVMPVTGTQWVHTETLYQIAWVLAAAQDPAAGLRALRFLRRVRETGGWSGAYWLHPRLQAAEPPASHLAALPILLAGRLKEMEALDFDPYPDLVLPAARHLVTEGPLVPGPGGARCYHPRWLTHGIAALTVAAEFASGAGATMAADHLRMVADHWESNFDRWTFSPQSRTYQSRFEDLTWVPLREGEIDLSFVDVVGAGLRAPDHPAVELIWRSVRRKREEMPRAYEAIRQTVPLAIFRLQRLDPVARLARSLEGRLAARLSVLDPDRDQEGGPEAPSFTIRELIDYVRLVASVAAGNSIDRIEALAARYEQGRQTSAWAVWSVAHPVVEIRAGQSLRIQLSGTSQLAWTADGWNHHYLVQGRDSQLGFRVADLGTSALPAGTRVQWTEWARDGSQLGPMRTVLVT